jgi:hypothetical protein
VKPIAVREGEVADVARGRRVQDVALPGDKKPVARGRRTGHCGRCGKSRSAGTEYLVHDLTYSREFYACERCGRVLAAMSGYQAEPAIWTRMREGA